LNFHPISFIVKYKDTTLKKLTFMRDFVKPLVKGGMSLLLLFVPFLSFSQSPEVKNVQLTERNDTLSITYDIEKCQRREQLDVSVMVNLESGKQIRPRAVTGDVGLIPCGKGKGKQILWDLNRDQVFINEKITVDIDAIPLGIPERFVSRGRALWMSALVPGLGISKLNKGGAHWLLAIATYGAAAGSAVFYFLADDTYSSYLAETDIDKRNALYDKTENQSMVSDVLLYTAGAVWLGNMIWTLVQPNKTKQAKGLTVGGTYDPVVGTPVFAVKYRF